MDASRAQFGAVFMRWRSRKGYFGLFLSLAIPLCCKALAIFTLLDSREVSNDDVATEIGNPSRIKANKTDRLLLTSLFSFIFAQTLYFEPCF